MGLVMPWVYHPENVSMADHFRGLAAVYHIKQIKKRRMKSKTGRTRVLSYLCILPMAFIIIGCNGIGGNVSLESTEDSLSYAIGADFARNVSKQPGLENIDPDLVAAAIRQVMDSTETPLLDEAESTMTIRSYITQQQTAQAQKQQKMAQENLIASEEWLESNKSEEGIQVTESGLQYKVIEEGSGAAPGPEDRVKVHYEGKTIDGNIFDSSLQRGEPIVFGVNQVIPGWTEGLQLMKEGAKYMLYIPPGLGYGVRGAGQDIGPNQALIFEVQLIEVNPDESAPAQ